MNTSSKKQRKYLNLIGALIRSFINPNPFLLRVIPTDRCNLNCQYCWQKKMDSYEMSLPEFKSYIDHAKKLGTGVVSFLGGEPMTWPHIYEAISICSKRNVLTDITTNGTLLNSETIDKFGRAGLDFLNISVDQLTVNEITQKNFLQKTKDLKALKTAEKKYKMRIRVNAVLYKQNIKEIKRLIEFTNKKKIPISIGYIVPSLKNDIDENKKIHFTLEDKEILEDIISYILAKKKEGYMILDPDSYFTNIFKYLKKESFWECNYPTRFGWINIAPNGKIRSCTKKMDELNFKFLDLSPQKISQLRNLLAKGVKRCNPHCYSNCAYDFSYYRTHKLSLVKKIVTSFI